MYSDTQQAYAPNHCYSLLSTPNAVYFGDDDDYCNDNDEVAESDRNENIECLAAGCCNTITKNKIRN